MTAKERRLRIFERGALLLVGLALVFPARVAAQRAADLPSLRPPEIEDRDERAIQRGLAFLVAAQQPDGSFGKNARERPGWQTYPTAMTALAGLAFLSSGSTPTRGPYAENLRRITNWLLTNCYKTPSHDPGAPGLLYNPNADELRPMYCHAFAMTYLALIFAQETDPARRETIRNALHDAIRLTERTQSSDGGWGYTPNFYEDEGTLVVTQLQGLRTCKDAGIHVPKRVIDRAVTYLRDSTNPDGSVRYRVSASRSNTRDGVSCAAIVALWQAGRYDDPLLGRIRGYVERDVLPSRAQDWRYGHHAEYVQYYLAQSQLMLGGESWQRYYSLVSNLLVTEQSRDGSWEGKDRGDVFGTTIALLVLQMPYQRLSVYQR